MTANQKSYQGWRNRATWNVALYLNNDRGLYFAARDFMRDYSGRCPYIQFIYSLNLDGQQTPDGYKWDSKSLAYSELNAMMRELKD